MFHNSQIRLQFIKPQFLRAGKSPEWKWILTEPDDKLVKVVREPKAFHIVVVGASGPKSAFMDGMGEPVTKEIHG